MAIYYIYDWLCYASHFKFSFVDDAIVLILKSFFFNVIGGFAGGAVIYLMRYGMVARGLFQMNRV